MMGGLVRRIASLISLRQRFIRHKKQIGRGIPFGQLYPMVRRAQHERC